MTQGTVSKKIILNAYQFAPAITGTDRMAHNFLIELQKIDTSNRYYVLCSPETYHSDIITASNFSVIHPPRLQKFRIIQRIINKLWRIFLPYFLKPLKADVYLSFHNMRLPRIRVATRMIASNLDLIPMKFKQYARFEPGFSLEARSTVRMADAFIAISEFSKQELCHELSVQPDKVTVVPLAPDPKFYQPAVGSEFGNKLPEKFILTIGGGEPRKNVQTVIDAFLKLPSGLQEKYPLLIAGGAWNGVAPKTLIKNEHMQALGYVSDQELQALYAKTSVFVFASLYEGFGFTILEAMASGAPVISSHSSSLPEVAGEAAILFEPSNADDLSEKIEIVLTDSSVRTKLTTSGKVQSKKFSWEESTKQLLNVLTGV